MMHYEKYLIHFIIEAKDMAGNPRDWFRLPSTKLFYRPRLEIQIIYFFIRKDPLTTQLHTKIMMFIQLKSRKLWVRFIFFWCRIEWYNETRRWTSKK